MDSPPVIPGQRPRACRRGTLPRSRVRRSARALPLSPTTRGARVAQSSKWALRVSLLLAVAACVHHADVAERKIKTDGIVGIQRTQRRRDVCGHPPSGTGVSRQTKAPSEADHMRIERNNQFRVENPRTHAEVHLIASYHPTKKKIQHLSRAAGRMARKG